MAFASGRTYPEWVAHWPEVEYFDPHFGESSTGGIEVIDPQRKMRRKGIQLSEHRPHIRTFR